MNLSNTIVKGINKVHVSLEKVLVLLDLEF